MANDMCTRRLTRELRSIQSNPLVNPKVYTTPLESNILEWHYVIEGHDNSPYEGGYYWGKLIFPKEYPLKPPSVIMLTPNGRFQTGRRLCLSMSDFHPGMLIFIYFLFLFLIEVHSIFQKKKLTTL